jgi:hypothetical protein
VDLVSGTKVPLVDYITFAVCSCNHHLSAYKLICFIQSSVCEIGSFPALFVLHNEALSSYRLS